MRDEKQLSKFLSLVLRHKPEVIGLTLAPEGWVGVYSLIEAMKKHGHDIDMVTLKGIVERDNKGRYSFDEKENNIRANQGHSANVAITFEEVVPPAILYHGTNKKVIDEIGRVGIMKMSRHHVHLSKDISTAKLVGERRGSPVIIEVDALKMHYDGIKFYLSENNVYLTDYVSPKYLKY